MKDLRKIRLMAIIASVTACLLMFSVGFSVWFKVEAPEPVTPDEDGSFEAYDVLTIHMKGDNGMNVFKSSLLSFKKSDTLADTDTGTIEVTYVVPKSTVAATVDSGDTTGSFTVDFSLGYSSLISEGHQLFGHAFSTTYPDNSYSVSVVYGTNNETKKDLTPQFASVQEDGVVIDDTIICSYTFENITTDDDFVFTLIYTFKIPPGLTFKESFGQYLNGTESTEENPNADTTKFSASAVVTDN